MQKLKLLKLRRILTETAAESICSEYLKFAELLILKNGVNNGLSNKSIKILDDYHINIRLV